MVISTYEQLNNDYVKLRNKLLCFILREPIKFVMKKAVGNSLDKSALEQIQKMCQAQAQAQTQAQTQANMKQKLRLKLKTSEEIDNFLTSLK
jgi:hypothetical protein